MTLIRLQKPNPLEAYPMSIGLLGACVFLFAATDLGILGQRGMALKEWGANSQMGFWSGQLWRPLTAMFLHGGMLHILFNGYALWQLCPALEHEIGTWRFSIIYFGAGLAGSVASVMFEPASLGASGAICGIMATYIRFDRIRLGSFKAVVRDPIASQFVFWLAINIVFGLMTQGISNAGHIGGILGGWLFAWAIFPALKGMHRGAVSARPSLPRLAAAIVVLVAAGTVAMVPVWSAGYWVYRGMKAAAASESATASGYFRKAASAPFGSSPAMFFLAGLEEQEAGRDDAALELYALAVKKGFRDPEMSRKTAEIFAKRGDSAALAELARQWKGVPEAVDGQSYFDSGLAAQRAHHDETAWVWYAASEQIGFDDPALLNNMALILDKRGDDAGMLALLRRWRERGKPLDEWSDRLDELEKKEKHDRGK